ncbi:MAG: DUF4229 domain-containing protein [Mycetocola sp.]
MKSSRSVLVYTVLRLAVFVIPFVIFLSIGVMGPYAALYAAIIGLILSLLFLRGSRDKVADAIDRTRHGERTTPADEDIEDAAVDGATLTGTAPESSASEASGTESDESGRSPR